MKRQDVIYPLILLFICVLIVLVILSNTLLQPLETNTILSNPFP